MNVTCDKCGKRYVISDDKLAGKSSVKIRCKQCQHLIAVTVQAPAADANAWEDERTRAMPAMDPATHWFAMIGGAQQGPFDPGELQEKVQAGQVTLRTYLWKAGMAGWVRAGEVAEVSPLFAGVQAPKAAPAPPAPPPPPQRDVATSRQAPAPEVVQQRDPRAAESAVVARAATSQSLGDLFGEGSGPGATEARPDTTQDEARAPGDEPAEAPEGRDEAQERPSSQEHHTAEDPFAQLSANDGVQAPPIGEATRFFIAQAGVNKRNPPWKIALFVLAFIGGPIAIVYLLNTFEIVKLPLVTRTTESGEVVQESFFSAGGASGLKDLLTGEAQKKRAEAERRKREAQLVAQRAAAQKAAAHKAAGGGADEPEPEVVKPKPQDPSLAAFYGESDRSPVGPRVRKDAEAQGGAAVNTAGLSQEAVAKVVADKAKAFQTCIENALRRNPNLAVGNVTVVLTVGPSGAVKAAGIEPRKHEGSEWGQCMISSGKRIVFPASDAETQLELPFKVGVAVMP